MKRLVAAVLVASFCGAAAAAAEPDFSDFPAKTYLTEDSVLPEFRGAVGRYKTRITEGMKEGPNLGGHFTLVDISCGMSCSLVFLIDASNGRVVELPLGGEQNHQLQMEFGLDSTLLRADWMDTSVGDYDSCVRQYFDIGSGAVTKLSETTYKLDRYRACRQSFPPTE